MRYAQVLPKLACEKSRLSTSIGVWQLQETSLQQCFKSMQDRAQSKEWCLPDQIKSIEAEVSLAWSIDLASPCLIASPLVDGQGILESTLVSTSADGHFCQEVCLSTISRLTSLHRLPAAHLGLRVVQVAAKMPLMLSR